MTTTTSGSATDLITFSRGSLATVTDSNGYIKWAPHNLLLRSEQLDSTTSWTRYNGGPGAPTLTAANAAVAPNGTTTAEDFSFPAIASAPEQTFVIQAISVSAGVYTAGIWVKAKSSGDVGKKFSLITYDTGAAVIVGLSHHTLTADWVLVTATGTSTAATLQFYFGATGSSTAGGGNQASFSCYVWGAHLYRSDLGGMQANASAYPYYNPSTPKNLLGYSEAFDNAYWTKSNTSISANAIAAPNGSLSADKVVENTSNAFHYVGNIFVSVSVSTYTASFYAKESGRSIVGIDFNNGVTGSETYFNLASGTVGTTAAGVTASITNVGNGWYRCSVTRSFSSATSSSQLVMYPTTADNVKNYTGDGTSGVYLWGAQLSDSASLDPYVGSYGAAPSAAAAYGPRLDYDPSTLAAKGLLVEEQRTNLALWSSDFRDTTDAGSSRPWVYGNVTITADAIASPDGTSNAEKIIATSTSGVHTIVQNLSVTSGSTYTLSVMLKAGGETTASVIVSNSPFPRVKFDLSAGTITSSQGGGVGAIMSLGNGWYRCSMTFSAPDASINIGVAIRDIDNNWSGNGVDGIFAYGAQLEAGAFATSYIPTAAATVTRNADVAFVATSQFPYSATEGSIVANVTPLNVAAARRALQIDDGTENERYTLSTNSTPNGLFTVIDGGSSQAAIATGTPAANTNIKLAARYKVDDFALSVNGGAASTDTSGTLPIANLLMRLGSGTSSTEPLNGHIRQITYIPRALTNAELIARST
jgi:hypothetical protein